MKIAYATTFNAQDVHNWSGTPFHMSHAFETSGVDVDYIGSLKRRLPRFFKIKQAYNKFVCDKRESPRFNCYAAKHYSEQVALQLQKSSAECVISPLINPIAYLDCNKPVVLWTDAVYAALVGFYPPFAYHSAETIEQGNEITRQCLSRCDLAVFSSQWAANSAIELYGIRREKVKVVPYGANIETYPNLSEIKNIIHNRTKEKIKLLFLAKSWERKGGDIVVTVTKALHNAGHPVELNIVGYTPKLEEKLPYINCLGFISKQTEEGRNRLMQLVYDSHFLFVPSRADACPMVFAEANAFGLPCLTTHVGGIATAVKNNVNGMTFGLDAPLSVYCDYIVDTLNNSTHYESLALSSYNEYEARLNWKVAVKEMRQLLEVIR